MRFETFSLPFNFASPLWMERKKCEEFSAEHRKLLTFHHKKMFNSFYELFSLAPIIMLAWATIEESLRIFRQQLATSIAQHSDFCDFSPPPFHLLACRSINLRRKEQNLSECFHCSLELTSHAFVTVQLKINIDEMIGKWSDDGVIYAVTLNVGVMIFQSSDFRQTLLSHYNVVGFNSIKCTAIRLRKLNEFINLFTNFQNRFHLVNSSDCILCSFSVLAARSASFNSIQQSSCSLKLRLRVQHPSWIKFLILSSS